MQVPTVPTFVAGDISIAKIQQLSACVLWVSNAAYFPVWHLYKGPTTGQGVSATTWTSVVFSNTAYDSDGVSTGGGGSSITIHTQGYYVVEACVPVQTLSTSFDFYAGFLWTAGDLNPHYAAGTTRQFGIRSGWSATGTGMDETLCPSDVVPVVCYPDDTIAVQIYSAVGCTIDASTPASAVADRFTCNFTGRFVRTGS